MLLVYILCYESEYLSGMHVHLGLWICCRYFVDPDFQNAL